MQVESFDLKYDIVHKVNTTLFESFLPNQNTTMTHPDQWAAQARDAPRPDVPNAKQPLPGIAPIQQDERYTDSGAPFDSGRFKPKTRINDPIFLIVFVAQVPYCTVLYGSVFLLSHARRALDWNDVANLSASPSPSSLWGSASYQRWHSQLGYPKAGWEVGSGTIIQGRPSH